MRSLPLLLGLTAASVLASVCAVPQTPGKQTYRANNRELSYASDGVVHLNAGAGDGVAWLNGAQVADERVSLDVKGADLQGRSFVGIAFRGTDDQHYDVVYLRPFNFNAAEKERRAHSLQYVSLPDFDWERLRKEFPGKYEAEVLPSPNPDAWVHLELDLKGEELSVFVNGAKLPTLQIKLLSKQPKGAIGLWVGNNSDGDFRRVEIKSR
jgi:hypothetical protein